MTPSPQFSFQVLAWDGNARSGRLQTAHGTVNTPAFMPVGTAATVKGLTSDAVAASGTEIILANAYHLMLRPGAERIARLGGLHQFMNWPGPILTDSGGFQVMSLAELRSIDEGGVAFRSHLDGVRYRLTPERAVEIQHLLDADISMVLDECTSFPASEEEAAASMRRSMRWAERCKSGFDARPGYALFGIVQGGVYPRLREESVEALTAIGFDGYAVGGLAIGEGRRMMFDVVVVTTSALPLEAPRYLMGVGKPLDLVGAVRRGIDLFDCVLPTRSGRTGQAFTRRGAVSIRNTRHAEDPRPLDPDCRCLSCTAYSRAYLHHLFRAGEMLGPILLSRHNVHYYQELMSGLRQAIEQHAMAEFVSDFEAALAQSDLDPL